MIDAMKAHTVYLLYKPQGENDMDLSNLDGLKDSVENLVKNVKEEDI